MKKILLIFSLLLFLFPSSVFAQDNRGRIVTLPQNETIDDDYFGAGQTVHISGTVNGDVYAAGGQVIIDGTVNGDLIAAGGIVNISGMVSEDVRVVGGQIIINGQIGKNLTVGSGTVEIGREATLSGNLVAGANSIVIAAPINGNIRAGAETVNILDKVSGKVEVAVNNLRIASGGAIGGDLIYYSDNEAIIEKEATVSGQISRRTPQQVSIPERGEIQNYFRRTTNAFRMVGFISSLLIGLLFIYLFPKFTKEVASVLTKGPWLSLGIGLLSIILFPFAFVILALTIVGIPLAFILFFLFLIILYLVKIFISYFLGSFTLQKLGKKAEMVWVFVLGLVIYFVLASIPFLGPIFSAAATLFGLGALLIQGKNLIRK